MELEIYESELADYSLQDSPFYEANTPIIFGLTASSSIFASNNSAAMVDALNLSAKKSSIMMSAKCQSIKLAFECSSSNGSDGHTNITNTTDLSPKKRCSESTERFYSTTTTDLDRNATDSNMHPKKKRKCVSFLPNLVQVNQIYFKNRISRIDHAIECICQRIVLKVS